MRILRVLEGLHKLLGFRDERLPVVKLSRGQQMPMPGVDDFRRGRIAFNQLGVHGLRVLIFAAAIVRIRKIQEQFRHFPGVFGQRQGMLEISDRRRKIIFLHTRRAEQRIGIHANFKRNRPILRKIRHHLLKRGQRLVKAAALIIGLRQPQLRPVRKLTRRVCLPDAFIKRLSRRVIFGVQQALARLK